MRTHSNRTSPAPLYPPASWSNVEARFDHFEDLVRESGRSVPFMLSGRMTCDPKGRPMRRIPTPSATRHEGLIQSVKNHRTMHWEAEAERLLILHSEVDAEFLNYSCQPHRLDLYVMSPQEGQSNEQNIRWSEAPFLFAKTIHEHLVYYPDMLRTTASGKTEIIEAKQDYHDAVRNIDYLTKILAARRFYNDRGIRFSLLTAADDLSKPILSQNVRAIALDRHASISTSDLLVISRHMARRSNKSTYGELVEELCQLNSLNAQSNRAKVNTAIVQRLLAIDLTKRLQSSSPIWAIGDTATFPEQKINAAPGTAGAKIWN